MPKEGRFYVEYLGWKETRGLHGSQYVDPVVEKLLTRQQAARTLHRMTIKVNKEELQIFQHVTGSNGKPQKIKYPAQQMCDVSYVSQCAPRYKDVVGCIFLGYNSKTHCAAHVHSYRFDSADTATIFVKLVNSIIARPEYRQRVEGMERDLFRVGHVTVGMGHHEHDGMGSDGGSYGSHSPNSSDSGLPRNYPTADQALKARKDIHIVKRTQSDKRAEPSKLFGTVQDELSHKLTMQQKQEMPILLPPKDYDTIVRRYGHLSIRAKVKQRSVIGADSVFKAGPHSTNNTSSDGNNNPSKTQKVRIQSFTLYGIQQGSIMVVCANYFVLQYEYGSVYE